MLRPITQMKKLKFLIVALLAGCLYFAPALAVTSASTPRFDWLKESKDYYNGIERIQQTDDGSTVLMTYDSIVKYDSLANKTWSISFNPSTNNPTAETPKDFCLTKAGEVVVLAVDSTSKVANTYLISYDKNGKQTWKKTLNSITQKKNLQLVKVFQASDGSFLLAGVNDSDQEIYLCKTNQSGDIEWLKLLKKDQELRISGLTAARDGGCVLIGNSYTKTKIANGADGLTEISNPNGFLLKTDKQGNLLWETKLTANPHSSVMLIQESTDGQYMIGGYTGLADHQSTPFIAKINSAGTVQWQKQLAGQTRVLNFIKPTLDQGCLVLAGSYITKLNKDGNIIWEKCTYGSAQSITETADGYLATGIYIHPPGLFYLTTQKLSGEKNTALPTNYNTLNPAEKIGYLISSYELQIIHLEQYIATIKKSGLTASAKLAITQELTVFEKTSLNITRDIEKTGNSMPMYRILYENEQPLVSRYTALKLQYQTLANTNAKQILLTDELQKRYGKMSKVAGANMDGIIVTKAGNSYYNLDLSKVQKYTISENRIDIVTNGKTYFLYLDNATKFPTYVGLGIQKDNIKYIFNTSKLSKPVANEWILINDVIKYMMDNQKKTTLTYKDLVITKGKDGIYTIKISRVYTTPSDQHFIQSGSWATNSSYYDIATKGPVKVNYLVRTGDCISGGYIAPTNALLKFKNFSYRIYILK